MKQRLSPRGVLGFIMCLWIELRLQNTVSRRGLKTFRRWDAIKIAWKWGHLR